MKQEEKKPLPWDVSDPKLPVVQSGHMENQRRNETLYDKLQFEL